MTLRIMTPSTMKLNEMTPRIMTKSKMTPNIITLGLMTLSMMNLIVTLKAKLSPMTLYIYIECDYTECRISLLFW